MIVLYAFLKDCRVINSSLLDANLRCSQPQPAGQPKEVEFFIQPRIDAQLQPKMIKITDRLDSEVGLAGLVGQGDCPGMQIGDPKIKTENRLH